MSVIEVRSEEGSLPTLLSPEKPELEPKEMIKQTFEILNFIQLCDHIGKTQLKNKSNCQGFPHHDDDSQVRFVLRILHYQNQVAYVSQKLKNRNDCNGYGCGFEDELVVLTADIAFEGIVYHPHQSKYPKPY